MKKQVKQNLIRKGWSEEDIDKSEEIIEERKINDKSRSIIHSNRILFWTVLFVMIIGNTLVAFILIPLLLVMTQIAMDFFAVFIGFVVGFLFNFLIWDIEEHLTRKHHLFAVLIIPILAVVNLFGITKISNAINSVFVISEVRGDPLIISALYVVGFLTPYLFTLFYKKKIKRY